MLLDIPTLVTARELTSTNDVAKALLPLVALPLVVVAASQTAGRGRENRRWWTGPGALAVSFGLALDAIGLDQSATASLALGTVAALLETVVVIGGETLRPYLAIDPPNDLLLHGHKIAGILIESPSRNGVVIGIGVNTNCRIADAPPEVVARQATSLLDATGHTVDHATFLATLWENLRERIRMCVHG